ncbi:MAG: diguanylate cyclase/phosphodiesterase (GGDEF & EAL domains) with PAS/PAC sensor(s) [Nitrospira sp.]|jgi:PAS domain S-box-containing protein|nr:MAG: diguanylate cyclase/phosphodiesterase (GGDEF & EAL domains) with PAS/PAC sensor(s) [Nitrospira sp.]
MVAGLFLGLLLFLSFFLWALIRQRQENVLNSTVVAATNCSVLVTDATLSHHPIIYANPAFLLLTGYAEQEVIGQTTSILTGPDTDRASMEKLAMALQDGWACRVRLCHYRKNGTSFWNDVSLSPVKDRLSRVTSIVWTMNEVLQQGPVIEASDSTPNTDIAACRQAEQALRDSETRLNLAVQTGQVGFFELDHRTDSLCWSPILRDICGIGLDEPASWQRYFELVHADDRVRIISTVQRARDATDNGRYEVEHRLVRPDGGVRHISLRSVTSFDGDGSSGQPVRTLGTVVDVTDRKNMDARRRETARMEAISTFAGGIAHELNNGLTAVLGFSELTLPLIPAESKAHRHIRQVIAAGKRSRELIQQLLAFGGHNDQDRCPLLLHSLAKESLRFLRPTIPLWIELRAQVNHATNPVLANAVQMHEMIFNLVDHALRAMKERGGVLEVQLQNRHFETDQILPSGRLPAGSYVCLSVQDTGDGMDSDRVSRLVASFVSSKAVSERQSVGLAVVYDIVTAHGGILMVESHIGAGTTVSVYLPALPICAPSTTQADDPLPRGQECILFVDDEDSVVRFAREVLEFLGYYPVVCRTAAEALEVFQVEPKRFDLLITDRTMPGMSGNRLARECRQLRPDFPVILCSGSNGVPDLDDTCSQSVTECLLKPLTLHELAYAIRRALDTSLACPGSPGVPTNSAPEPSRISIEVSDAVGPRG